jgi:HSP20 family protein
MASGYLTPFRRGSLSRSSGGPASVFGGGSLFDLHRQMNRLFDDLFDGDQGTGSGQTLLTAPALEVHQTADKIEITAELPGVRQEDIDLTVEDGVLTLRGEKRSTRTDEERGYSERSYGRFERSITLPSNIDEENCSADFKDGVLTIAMPKTADRQRGRRIPLNGGRAPQQLEAQNDEGSAPRQQAAEENPRQSGQMG